MTRRINPEAYALCCTTGYGELIWNNIARGRVATGSKREVGNESE
jgi:hypothetical protein